MSKPTGIRPEVEELYSHFRYEITSIHGSLSKVLSYLLPLSGPGFTRHLFIPTRSSWTAYFNNHLSGSDTNYAMSLVSKDRLNCRGIGLGYFPLNHRRQFQLEWHVLSPEENLTRNTKRVITLSQQGNNWEFNTYGEALDFEFVNQYQAFRRKDRFSLELLDTYMQKLLGTSPFDEYFYLPDHLEAILIERTDLSHIHAYSLEDAQQILGYL